MRSRQRVNSLSGNILSSCLHIFLTVLIFQGGVRADQINPKTSLQTSNQYIRLYPGQSEISLAHRFLIESTDTLRTDEQMLLRSRHYSIDYVNGHIKLNQVFSDSTILAVTYQYLPIQINTSYKRRSMVIAHVLQDTVHHVKKIPRPTMPQVRQQSMVDRAQLHAGGSKTFSILTGSNRDASLEQSLRVEIAGKAGKNIDIVAILSDKTNPIQPDGNTRQLRELDQVYVQVKTPSTQSTMGDHTLVMNQTSLVSYNRKIQGIHGRVRTQDSEFELAAAVSEGEFKSQVIQGIEGVQGPYQLTGQADNLDFFIIAGTEKIWIDGELMIRGADNDYTIDYINGQITFTRNRLITGESRITVDYEASEAQFQRNILAGRGIYQVGANTSIGATYIREGDDRNSPQFQSLGSDDIQFLQKASIEGGQIRRSGVKLVGEGNGGYRKAYDELEDMDYFIYVGEANGNYEVSFSKVDSGEGTYSIDENGRYKFVGPAQGDFLPETFLKAPVRKSVAGLDINSQPMKGVTISGEIAVSTLNPNILTSRGNSRTREGRAFHLSTGYESQGLYLGNRNLGKFEARGTIRSIDPTFTPSGRINDVEFHRQYGQSSQDAWQGRFQEFRAAYEAENLLRVTSDIGVMKRSTGFSADRRGVNITLTPRSETLFTYRYDNIDNKELSVQTGIPGASSINPVNTSGRWRRHYFQSHTRVGHFKPYFGIEMENRAQNLDFKQENGRNFIEYKTGLDYKPSSNFSSSTSLAQRNADIVGGPEDANKSWLNESVAHTIQQQFSIKGHKSFSAFLRMTHRSRTYKDAPGENNRDQMIDNRIQYTPLDRAISLESRYEISNERSSLRSRRYVLVGRGNGNFRLDPFTGEFLPDAAGEYLERYDHVGVFTPVSGVKSSFRLQLKPDRLKSAYRNKWPGLLNLISTDTYFAVEERSKSTSRSDLYMLRLSTFQQDSTTVLGNLTFRQDVFFISRKSGRSIRLRYRNNRLLNNQLISGSERRNLEAYSLRIRSPFAMRSSAEIQVAREVKFRRDSGVDRFDLLSYNGSLILSNRPKPPLEIRLQVQTFLDHDRLNQVSATLLSLAPRFSYAFRGKGVANFELDWSNVRTDNMQSYLPFEMVNGRRPGDNARWTGNMNYRIGSNFSLLMQYDGRKDPFRKVIHTARAEFRAYF